MHQGENDEYDKVHCVCRPEQINWWTIFNNCFFTLESNFSNQLNRANQ